MRAGRMRDVVDIQENHGKARDAFGGTPEDWNTVGKDVPAEVESTDGGEIVVSDQVVARLNYVVKLRHFPGLTTKHRFLLGGKPLGIASIVDPDRRQREMVCVCTERVSV